ncbi:DUF6076 domain-containing protein [Dysosmobacter sp.]
MESLLSFQELDSEVVSPLLKRISSNWEKWTTTEDRDAMTAAMMDLGELKQRHIYFQLLYTRCYHRISDPKRIRGDAEDQQILTELQEVAEQIPQYQKQIQRFFELVLDVDQAGRDPQKQAWSNYLYNEPKDPGLFKFRPIPVSFEPTEEGRCSPVLYSGRILDMIDYSLRSCVERQITVRRCKHCGRWFPQMVRVSAEYCERPVAEGEQVCREIGAFQKWTKKQSDDPVFKIYRREYKKRFARIKAGEINDDDFKLWSKKARAEKKKCDSGSITLEEFQQWLKDSK